MSGLERILLVRHGETVGQSSVRFYGRTDVPLDDIGRAQMREAARVLPVERFELVVASSLSRAWESATILAPGAPVRLEARFREIDFGRWEGLTADEIAARDPRLHREWREKANGFEYPEGELRSSFGERVREGLCELLAGSARSALVVAHKGVIREIAQALTGEPIEPSQPPLAGAVLLRRDASGSWSVRPG